MDACAACKAAAGVVVLFSNIALCSRRHCQYYYHQIPGKTSAPAFSSVGPLQRSIQHGQA